MHHDPNLPRKQQPAGFQEDPVVFPASRNTAGGKKRCALYPGREFSRGEGVSSRLSSRTELAPAEEAPIQPG